MRDQGLMPKESGQGKVKSMEKESCREKNRKTKEIDADQWGSGLNPRGG